MPSHPLGYLRRQTLAQRGGFSSAAACCTTLRANSPTSARTSPAEIRRSLSMTPSARGPALWRTAICGGSDSGSGSLVVVMRSACQSNAVIAGANAGGTHTRADMSRSSPLTTSTRTVVPGDGRKLARQASLWNRVSAVKATPRGTAHLLRPSTMNVHSGMACVAAAKRSQITFGVAIWVLFAGMRLQGLI